MKKLELRINNLEKHKLEKIQKYIESEEFQKDFYHGYLEEENKKNIEPKYSGKILTISGDLVQNTDIYTDVIVKLREDDNLDYSVVRNNLNKLATHYKKIIGIIFSKPNTL
jgi:hypothetical protein